VEGKQSYISLLFIPRRAPFDLWDREQRHGLKLYVRRVFIMESSDQLMPRYLRFVRGVIDSDDLPLNVSREVLQRNKQIDTIRNASVKKVLDVLENMAKNDKEKYATFWTEFGRAMKEGPVEDHANRERIAKLLRFSSTHNTTDAQDVSLEDYVARMKTGQEKIYYITAETYAAAKSSPHLEVFRKKGIEVLLLHDRIDEWMMSYLTEFDGRKFQSIAKGDLELGSLEGKEEKQELDKAADEYKDLLKKMHDILGESVKEVRVTHRLVDYPSCLVVEDQDIAINLRKMLEAAGQHIPSSKPILEINPQHPLVKGLKQEKNEQRFEDWTHILHDQAMLSEGGQLDDPAMFVSRLNSLLLTLSLRG